MTAYSKSVVKKIWLSVMATAILAFTAGCSQLQQLELPPLPEVNQQAVGETSAAEESTELPAEELSSETQENYVIVKMDHTSSTHMDPQNGTQEILIFSYDSPVVYVGGRDEVTEKIGEQLAALTETYITGLDYGFGSATGENLLLELATDHYTMLVNTEGGEMTAPYSANRTVKVMRADDQLVSLLYNTSEYTGGAHGNYMDRAYMFDTQSGEHIRLAMISNDEENLRAALLQKMLELYREDKDGYYSDRIITEMLNGSIEEVFTGIIRDGSWYLGRDGMVLFSDVYELGPYAAGITEFVIPYDEIKDYIQEKWLPKEHTTDGSLRAEERSRIQDGSMQVVDRITLDKDGQQICLVAEGCVYDIDISTVTYSYSFFETARIWSCSYMKDSLLELDVMIPDGIPNLMISYTDANGERESLLLTQSGEDGSLLLIDADIQALG